MACQWPPISIARKSAFDAGFQDEHLLDLMQAGKSSPSAVVMVTHSRDEAYRLCDSTPTYTLIPWMEKKRTGSNSLRTAGVFTVPALGKIYTWQVKISREAAKSESQHNRYTVK
jgi:hypothetical protein